MLNTNEIKDIIERERSSSFQRSAIIGKKYYEGHHDIENYRLFYYDGKGDLVEDKTKSNIKISHPFFTELIDQLVQYLLSGKDRYIFSDDSELQKLLDDQFNYNDDFNAELNELLTSCAMKGSEFMYLYKDENNNIKFEVADSLGIAEVRAVDTQDGIDYLIRWYIDRVDKDNETIKKIEVWTDSETYYFIEEGNKGIKLDDNEVINPRPHVILSDSNDMKFASSFGFIPFFRLDNNSNRKSDLGLVKSIIDDYDLMSCSLSNNLQDLTEGLFVVKGFNGDNMDELLRNLKTKKAVGVADGGDIDIRTIDIPYEARKTKMELDEKNIYRFGMGFNSAQVGDGNITNIVIKSRYVLLDLKANKLEIRLKKFLRKLVKVFIDEVNLQNGNSYSLKDIYFEFTRETLSNDVDNAQIKLSEAQTEQTRINTLLNMQGSEIVESETILKKICEVLDVDYKTVKDSNALDDESEPDERINNLDKTIDETEQILGRALNE